MRVLYFHQHFSTPAGSTGTRSYEFAIRLVSRGHQVTMICGAYITGNTGLDGDFKSGKRQGIVDGIKVIEFHFPYSNYDGFLKRTISFFKFAVRAIIVLWQEPHDVVFATSTPLTVGIPGIVARWVRGTPFIFEVRDLWPELPRAMGVITNPIVLWMLGVLEWCSYHSAVHVIGLAPGIVTGIEKRGIETSHISMIPNGCDLELFHPAEAFVTRLPQFALNDFIAIYAGAHGVANGLEQLIKVAAELKRMECSDIKLVFVGEGRMKDSLMGRAKEQSLDNCIFLDSVPKVQLANLLKMADVGLMVLADVPAFYFGTSPNKFFDYIASGLPVITNYPGWLAQLIEKYSCGILVPPCEAKIFAKSLAEMRDQSEVRESMSMSCRQLAESTFDRAYLADQFVDLVEKTRRI